MPFIDSSSPHKLVNSSPKQGPLRTARDLTASFSNGYILTAMSDQIFALNLRTPRRSPDGVFGEVPIFSVLPDFFGTDPPDPPTPRPPRPRPVPKNSPWYRKNRCSGQVLEFRRNSPPKRAASNCNCKHVCSEVDLNVIEHNPRQPGTLRNRLNETDSDILTVLAQLLTYSGYIPLKLQKLQLWVGVQ